MLARKLSFESDKSPKFSYTDYLSWNDQERWEIIDGVAYDMSPAPTIKHQDISFRLSGIFYQCLKNSRCRAFAAPFDVILMEDKHLNLLVNDSSDQNEKSVSNKRGENENIVQGKEIHTVVQPDLVVVCDDKKLKTRGCFGSPDIVVEILSKSTAYKDETEKLKVYEKHGVKEYWIVNPDAEYIMVYRLDGLKYAKPEYLIKEDTLVSHAVDVLTFGLLELWR